MRSDRSPNPKAAGHSASEAGRAGRVERDTAGSMAEWWQGLARMGIGVSP
jgi:hypothetical protein